MIKVITSQEKDNKEIDYPCLMIRNGLIVLMTREGVGAVVREDDDGLSSKLGVYSISWIMSTFEPYKGTITLENG